MAVGGGSGGHVTPVVAVLSEIKKQEPGAEVRFWCDKNFFKQASSIIHKFDKKIPVQHIVAGKLRRYHHLTVLQQLLWPSLVLKNVRDIFLVVIGFLQSLIKLIIWRPDVVFAKGGYVCLPVGLAARLLRIPLAIHDSDACPGLTNRLLSRWANQIMTGAPLDCYNYPRQKTTYVGIPVSPLFKSYNKKEILLAKRKWGVDDSRPLIVVTGGGLGATRINDTVVNSLEKIIEIGSVILISGSGQYDELKLKVEGFDSKKFQLHEFISEGMDSLFGAADLVVTRAGATTILELAASSKPTILIPNAKLTGGHQIKNAKVYADKGAVRIVDEDAMLADNNVLIDAISSIINRPDESFEMAKRFHAFSRPSAAKDAADIVLSLTK